MSASQPLFRQQNLIAYDQAKAFVTQADSALGIAQQELIIRVAVTYFDILLAQFNIELAESQKKAVSEQLAQAKRNFEVGVATITDTHEAQAKYDAIVAQEITVRNEYDNRLTALRAIIGRYPKELKKLGGELVPALPEPNVAEYWVDRALKENLNVQIAQYNFDIATLEVDRAKAANYPTVDLVASYGGQGSRYSGFVEREPRLAHGRDRRPAGHSALYGRLQQLEDPRGHCAAGTSAPGPRRRPPRGAVPGADRDSPASTAPRRR